MFNIWRDNGFPRSDCDVSYNRFKFSRQIFCNLVKQAKHQSTVEHYINVEKVKKIKPSSYWKDINLLRKKPNKMFTINNKTTNVEIASEFNQHFNTLLNTPRVSDLDNLTTNQKLCELLKTIQEQITEKDDFYITETDIFNALNKLKNGKSRDPFLLTAEHFTSARSDIFDTYLTNLINRILISRC